MCSIVWVEGLVPNMPAMQLYNVVVTEQMRLSSVQLVLLAARDTWLCPIVGSNLAQRKLQQNASSV